METNIIYQGDCLEILKTFQDDSINCVVTSPPYWRLRDYGTAEWEGGNPNCKHVRLGKVADGNMGQKNEKAISGDGIYKEVCNICGAKRIDSQLGIEKTPEEYVAKMVEVFREVKRVLKKNGTLWLNLGDTYAGSGCGTNDYRTPGSKSINKSDKMFSKKPSQQKRIDGLKPKDLVGIPWMVAKALQAPYYTGEIKNEKDRVWLAAMIDAEGCLTTSQYETGGKSKSNIYISITNSSRAIIDNCERIFPQKTKHIYEKADKVNRTVWRWDVEQIEKKMLFICEIYPYLVAKKKQAIIAYTFLLMQKGLPSKKKGYLPSQIENRKILVEKIQQANSGLDVELPHWVIEPPSLLEEGFYLRQDIIWHKPNPMPESVTDRCTKAHEYIFLLSKSSKYYFDFEAIQEKSEWYEKDKRSKMGRVLHKSGKSVMYECEFKIKGVAYSQNGNRNKRSVWTVNTKPYSEAHFAVYPPGLIVDCIKAGCPENGTVLDPFSGSGTTGEVALKLNRKFIGVELNPKYIEIANKRLSAALQTLFSCAVSC